jgi:uncharacterized membrane protein YhhN
MRLSLHLFDVTAGGIALAVLALIPIPAFSPWLPWLKAVPAALWGLSFIAEPGRRQVVPALALGFAAAGDFFLARGGAFLFGVLAFAVYQLLLGVRFWRTIQRRPKPRTGMVMSGVAYVLLTTVLLGFCLPLVGSLAFPLAAYGTLLTVMASGAAATRSLTLALGGALFYLSDALILGFQVWPTPLSTDWIVLVPYYFAQYLMVRGIREA